MNDLIYRCRNSNCGVILIDGNWCLSNQGTDGAARQFICIDCEDKEHKDYYQNNKEHMKQNMKDNRKKKKKIIIDHYGGECECCNISNYEFLSIEHKYNDGRKHKKENNIESTIDFYRWIIKNNFPSNLGLLCFNCNCSQGAYGYCPHKGNIKIYNEPIKKFSNWRRKIKICTICGIELNNNNQYCNSNNIPCYNKCIICSNYTGQYIRHINKLSVIDNYGGQCVCCGEDHWEFLTIDHIKGNGIQHKGSIGGNAKFYPWLIKNNFPQDDFRLLCYNCNCALGFHGKCPHNSLSNDNLIILP